MERINGKSRREKSWQIERAGDDYVDVDENLRLMEEELA